MEVQNTTAGKELVGMANPYTRHSQRLIECLVSLESPELKPDAKMELLSLTSDLMPEGKPKFLDVIKYPKIGDLVKQHGKKTMLKVLFLMVKDFCNSMNVVRNMNEDQMIEAAAMLIDESDNFRLEDYTMFFAMAKRGMLGKIYDRLDGQVISTLLDEYWLRRKQAATALEELEGKHMESLGPSVRIVDNLDPQTAELSRSADNLVGAISELKSKLKEWQDDK